LPTLHSITTEKQLSTWPRYDSTISYASIYYLCCLAKTKKK